MIFLDFEKPIEELHQKIQELRHVQTEESALDISKEIETLEAKSNFLKNIPFFSSKSLDLNTLKKEGATQ